MTRKLTQSYVLGLGVIAALGIAMTCVTVIRADRTKSDALRLNLTGRQRLLTQRLASIAYGNAAHAFDAHAPYLPDGSAPLAAARAEWAAGFRIIRDHAPTTAEDATLLDSISIARQHVESLMASAMKPAADARAIVGIADSVADASARLVRHLDRVMVSLTVRQHDSVITTQRIGVVAGVLLILLLAAETLIVFRPAVLALGTLLREQETAKAELHAKAKEMHQNNVQQELQNDRLQSQQQTLLVQQEELLAQQTTLIEQRDHLEQRTTELSRLTSILDATPDAVAVFSLTGEVLYTNSVAEQHLQHVRKRDWTHASHLLSPDSVRQLRDVGFPRAIRSGVWQGEATLRSRGGPTRTVVQTLLAHRGPDGRVATISVLLQDITQQKMLHDALSEGEARNRAVIEALTEGVVVQDRDGRMVTWNSSAERILGFDGRLMSGMTSNDARWAPVDEHGETLPGDRHPITRARLEGVSIDGEVMGVRRGDGERVWLSVNASPMTRHADPTAPAAVATFTDITKARLVAHELETLSVVARQSDHAIVTTATDGTATWVNPAWERLTGFTLAEALGRRPGELLQGTHTNTETIAQMRMAVSEGISWSGEVLNYRRDGTPYWIEMNITPSLDTAGGITGFVGLARDITARRNADRERQQLAAAVAVTADGIAITGVSGALEFVNHAFARMHGVKVADLLQTPWAALYEADEGKRLVRDAIPEVTQVGFWHGEAVGRHHDGTSYPQELSLTLLPHGGLVAVARDISERKAAEERLLHLSVRDGLTSLYNRRGFLEQAQSALRLATRQGLPCALLYGDLDSFKSVNDNFGHDIGDSALKTIAWILSNTFRDTDLIARLGGDEFTILAIDAKPADISVILERIDDAITRSNTARCVDPAQAWHLGISLGVAHFDPAAPDDVETLLRVADAAQYERKRARKARLAVQHI
ncbi:MAG: PAS domain S-box protein [Gemmatimonadaceae bacterium]|nr:PAS domain S-box protein [Gemmatimonadaceae bacterium]